LIAKANEHSKKLTIIDTVIYVFLMVGLIAVMIIWPHIAEYCVEAMGYVTTAFVAVRLGYSAKGAVENFISNGGDFIAYFCGHIHTQEMVTDSNGRVHLSFRMGGDNAEVVMIDKEKREINTVGLGDVKMRSKIAY
jgi:hypothetical protein